MKKKEEQKTKELSEKDLQILDIIFKDFSAKELVKELAYNDYIDFHEIRDYYFNELCTDDLIKERVIDDFEQNIYE